MTQKIALITGGSSGIGEAIVRRFAQDGHRVIFTYHSGSDRAQKISAETGAEARLCDLADPASVCVLVEGLPWVDILVSAAGIIEEEEGIRHPDFLAAWRRTLRVNLDAVAELVHSLVPGMAERGWGRVINISSVWGRIVPEARTAYGVSKAGLDALTRSISAEFARSGVTANAIAPGPVMTPIWTGAEDLCRQFGAMTPIGRPGRPEEIAALASFLASEGSSLITGQSIAADGGMTAAYPLPF